MANVVSLSCLQWRARLLPAAALVCMGFAAYAQTPDLPAAAEPTAPASHVGPPVPLAPLVTSPVPSTPLRDSTTMTLPLTTTDPSGTTLPTIKPVPAPQG